MPASIAGAMASVGSEIWRRSSATASSGPVLLDIDASLVGIHPEGKEETAPTHKGGSGFHPMCCFADRTGETLAALLGPGNVGFFVTARRNPHVAAAIFDAIGIEHVWLPALDGEGEERDDAAAVVEPTCLIDPARLPAGTRLIVRREPLPPGAQRSRFPTSATATGASTPTEPATRESSSRQCGPTRTSSSTSAA